MSKGKALVETINSDETKQKWQAVLPPGMSIERFQRTVIGALNRAPDLINADRRSLFSACEAAAQDGLILDNREAALVTFKGQVQYMPMVRGLIKIATDGTKIRNLEAHLVREGDDFTYEYGDASYLKHRPTLGNKGDFIGAYAIAHFKDGGFQFEVMSTEEIEKVRASSKKSESGPWVGWWGEMARKTVIRRLFKFLPADAIGEKEDEIGRVLGAGDMKDVTTSYDDDVDPETGEIIEAKAEPPARAKGIVQKKQAEDAAEDQPPAETFEAF